MKITLTIIKAGAVGPIYEKKEVECKGSGTETDPVIIEPSEDLPKYQLLLEDYDIFITIQNCYLERIYLDSCQNVRIENCNVWSITIQNCSKVFMNESIIRRTLTLWESNHVDCQGAEGSSCQSVPSLIIALSVTSSFRMQATNATFGFFPRARSCL